MKIRQFFKELFCWHDYKIIWHHLTKNADYYEAKCKKCNKIHCYRHGE